MQTSRQFKSDEDILASMVKSRECCRQAGKALEAARAAAGRDSETMGNLDLVSSADKAITQMLSHLENVPAKMGSAMSSESSRKYAARLLLEISELLEKAMIMERETRDIIGSISPPFAAQQRKGRAVRAYARNEAI